ncbi:MAG: ABC transporter transmembrane domain-containing protein, partial [Tumebacillaceae bacterium]
MLGLLVLVSTGMQLVNPQIMSRFIDTATGETQASSLILTALLFIGVALLAQIAAVAATYFGERVAWKATNALRSDLFEHTLKLDLSYHHEQTPGSMIERIDGDVTVLANFFSQFGVRVVTNLLLLVGMLVILFGVNWIVGLSFSVYSVIAFWVLKRMRNFAVPRWVETRQSSANLFGFLEERLAGMEDVRANGASGFVMRRLYELSRIKMKTDRKAYYASGISWNTTILLFAFATAMALAFDAYLYWRGQATLGTAFLIYTYVNMLRTPVEQIAQQMQDLQQAQACIQRTQALLGRASKIGDGQGTPLAEGALAVEFAQVTFGYQAEEVVLRNLSFRLEPGKKLGLLGRTG